MIKEFILLIIITWVSFFISISYDDTVLTKVSGEIWEQSDCYSDVRQGKRNNDQAIS